MAYGCFTDLERRTTKNPKYDGYQRGVASMVYNFFDKNSASLPDKFVKGSGVNIPLEFNEQLAEE